MLLQPTVQWLSRLSPQEGVLGGLWLHAQWSSTGESRFVAHLAESMARTAG